MNRVRLLFFTLALSGWAAAQAQTPVQPAASAGETHPAARAISGTACGVRPSPGAATAAIQAAPEGSHAPAHSNLAAPGDGRTPQAVFEAAPAAAAPKQVRRLEETELCGLIAEALNRRPEHQGAEWELRLTRAWAPVTVPEGPLCLEILEPAPNRISSSCILRFELRAGRERLGSWQAPIQARLFREVLVARSQLQRGQPLSEADFAQERRDVLLLRSPVCEWPAETAAFELAETVPAGNPLLARAVRLKPVVFRGQTADAIVRDGAMLISLKVEVLEEGVPGQVVRVRNPFSRRELRGKVQDEKTIAVIL